MDVGVGAWGLLKRDSGQGGSHNQELKRPPGDRAGEKTVSHVAFPHRPFLLRGSFLNLISNLQEL